MGIFSGSPPGSLLMFIKLSEHAGKTKSIGMDDWNYTQ